MERERNSSSPPDDDYDVETPINHIETNPSPRRGSFEIGEPLSRIGHGLFWSRRKYLLLAISLPFVLTFLYFSFGPRSLFSGDPSVQVYGRPKERMREAELRALYFLRNQQLGLSRLWNRTSTAMINGKEERSNLSAFSPPVVPFEEFRSALFEQIKLNREIQKALLSTHHAQNLSSEFPDDDDGNCRKVERVMKRRSIEWKPRKDRYLFAICVSGQISNHLICLEKHMFFAALLNRVLVIPSHHLDYQYDRVIDVNHINGCFNRKVVITFEEFAHLKKSKMRIDKFICYMASPLCYVDEEHVKKLRALGLSLAKLEAAWPEDAKSQEQRKRVSSDITSRFACEDEVLAIGDVFYADVEKDWLMHLGGPLSHKCKTVIKPSRLITLTAERFVQTFLGRNFIALHFRRHGFLKFCNAKQESCFFPIPQAAECILRVVEKVNAPGIYLSTDAAESETDLLQSLVVLNGRTVPLLRRPGHTHVEKWDALLYRNHLGGDNQVEAMLDKTICAMSSVFIGSSGSTFTDDIFRLRKDWGSASVCDEYLCQGQQPNFLASNE